MCCRALASGVCVIILLCTPSLAQGTAAGVTLDGKPINPLEAAPAKVVVLVFLRTDCPISNRYAPTVQALSTQYSGAAAFWLVYPDKSETNEQIQQYQQTYGYHLPALRDPQHALVGLSQAEITPEAAVFNKEGQLVYHGRIDDRYEDFGHARSQPTTHELDDAIRAALEGKRPAVTTASAVGCYISDLK